MKIHILLPDSGQNVNFSIIDVHIERVNNSHINNSEILTSFLLLFIKRFFNGSTSHCNSETVHKNSSNKQTIYCPRNNKKELS